METPLDGRLSGGVFILHSKVEFNLTISGIIKGVITSIVLLSVSHKSEESTER